MILSFGINVTDALEAQDQLTLFNLISIAEDGKVFVAPYDAMRARDVLKAARLLVGNGVNDD